MQMKSAEQLQQQIQQQLNQQNLPVANNAAATAALAAALLAASAPLTIKEELQQPAQSFFTIAPEGRETPLSVLLSAAAASGAAGQASITHTGNY